MDGIRGRILQFCDQLMTLAYLNILWIGFSLLGFIVCGFFPATVAMYTLIRRDLTDSKLDSSLASEFWKEQTLFSFRQPIWVYIYMFWDSSHP